MRNNELAQTIPTQNPQIDAMASVGRGGDTMMAHVTPGDYVIPKNVLVQHPEFLVKLKKVMSDMGSDYRTHMVGSGFENINPQTDAPEFWSPGKAVKSFSGGMGQAVRSGISNLTGSQSLGNFAGRGAAIGVGGALGLGVGGAPGAIAGANMGNIGYSNIDRQNTRNANALQEGQMYEDLYNKGYRANDNINEMALPGSLQELSGLNDEQKRSYLAAQGSQGEGLGGSSRDYYVNLLQRNIQANPEQNLLPIESQYLSRGGVNTNLRGRDLVNALRGF